MAGAGLNIGQSLTGKNISVYGLLLLYCFDNQLFIVHPSQDFDVVSIKKSRIICFLQKKAVPLQQISMRY